MLNMKLIKKILFERQSNTDSFIAAEMLGEITSCYEEDISEELLDKLLHIGMDIYSDTDYSTPIGVGIAIGEWLVSDYSTEKQYTEEEMYEEINDAYLFGFWR